MRSWTPTALGLAALLILPASAAHAKPRKARARSHHASSRAKADAAKSGAATGSDAPLRRGERVEFDARLIKGQTAKAGAVYLFERAATVHRSMVKERRSYRSEIVEAVFPNETDR